MYAVILDFTFTLLSFLWEPASWEQYIGYTSVSVTLKDRQSKEQKW